MTYTIADIATFPWVRNLIGFYEAADLVGITDFRACHAGARLVRGASRGGEGPRYPRQDPIASGEGWRAGSAGTRTCAFKRALSAFAAAGA